MQTQSNILKYTVYLISVVAFFVTAFLALQRANTYIRYLGFNDCSVSSRYEKTIPEEGVVVYYPLEDMYERCLVEKGLLKVETSEDK